MQRGNSAVSSLQIHSKEDETMYKIGELSKLCRIPVKTLRYYDSEGLLVPDNIDRFTGYRYYSAAKLAECNRIIALKELGFTLDEIRIQLYAKKMKMCWRLFARNKQSLKLPLCRSSHN